MHSGSSGSSSGSSPNTPPPPPRRASTEDVEEMQPRVILAVTPDQALVLAAEVQAEARHDRGIAIFAEAGHQP